ncbi:hypothetical protein V5O48_013247 [Marasmius crinis-equi]|uniref:Uncharacterized protein n=1 Tax=Marasmius crinis-equi TaxID=585013 RepID=A0ABR3F0N9_9AGAR
MRSVRPTAFLEFFANPNRLSNILTNASLHHLDTNTPTSAILSSLLKPPPTRSNASRTGQPHNHVHLLGAPNSPSNAFVASPFAATVTSLIQIYRNSNWVDLIWPSVKDMYQIAIDGRKKAVMTWAHIRVAAVGLGTSFSDLVAQNMVWQFNEGGVYSSFVHPTGQFGQDGSTMAF